MFQNLYAYSVCLVMYQLGSVLVGGAAFDAGTAVAVVLAVGFVYLLFRPAKKGGKNVLSVEA